MSLFARMQCLPSLTDKYNTLVHNITPHKTLVKYIYLRIKTHSSAISMTFALPRVVADSGAQEIDGEGGGVEER